MLLSITRIASLSLKVYPYMLFIDEHNYYVYHLFLWKLKQVVPEKPISEAKGESTILQGSIIKEVNKNVKAGRKAAFNPRFSNFTVFQFKRLLGVKPLREGDLKSILILTRPKLKNLPKEFDA